MKSRIMLPLLAISTIGSMRPVAGFCRGLSTFSQYKVTRFSEFPVDLFRIETKKTVSLREKSAQDLIKSPSFDLKLGENGLVNPAVGDTFIGPNGMSLRPAMENNWDIISNYKGKFKVVLIPKGFKLPEDLILLHERGDHYSLQTAIPRPLPELNARLTEILKPMERMSKEEYFTRYNVY